MVAKVFEYLGLVVIASWALLFAVLIGTLVYVTLLRGRKQRRPRASRAPQADPHLTALVAEIRFTDPHFDEQLLSEAAQMACLVAFAAIATGDEEAIRALAAPSFWSTFFGRYVRTSARDARRKLATADENDGASGRRARFPLDYQASAPELIDLELGPPQRARVRVSFSQLFVAIAPGAEGQAGMASAANLGSLAGSFGQAMGSQMNGAGSDLGWISWAGRYDLVFTRPAGARTDPGAAPASRTCAKCGAPYRSQLATACAFCQAGRPTPWGQWRLTSIIVVDD
jgi:hypothetical protein